MEYKENATLEELIKIGKNIVEENLENDTRIRTLKNLLKNLPDHEKEIFRSMLFNFNRILYLKTFGWNLYRYRCIERCPELTDTQYENFSKFLKRY